ncbi:MAG: MarR family EPS-associated transcriptional regulator [Pseudomonadota bacterium]
MSGRRSALREDVRFRVLRFLRENPEMSQRQLADALGVSLGATNYCLSALVDRGFVKLGNFSSSEDKRRYAYILTPKGLSEKAALTGRFLKRKRAEYEALKAEIDALQAEMEPEEHNPRGSGHDR